MLKVMWAMSMVPKPRYSCSGSWSPKAPLTQWAKSPQRLKKATKNRQRETPVTISALTMGMLFTVISGVRQRFFIL